MLYLAGKGDGNIRYYEIVDEAPYIYYLNQFLSGQPQKSLGFLPKRGVNVAQCEVFRFYKLHASSNICEPISMIVPRKSTLFQSDLYPDTLSQTPAISCKDWFTGGRNLQPILMSLQTGQAILDVPNKKITYNGSVKQKKKMDFEDDEKSKKKEKMEPDNISRKFAFLAENSAPDYRTQMVSI